MDQILNTEARLPFVMPDNAPARAWLEELDFVDLHEGPAEELRELAERAPSAEASSWLLTWIERRRGADFQPPCVAYVHAGQAAAQRVGRPYPNMQGCCECRKAGSGACWDGCEKLAQARRLLADFTVAAS